MSYIEFIGDDPGYKAWISANPDGFVVNAEKRKRPEYRVLHCADCNYVAKLKGGADEGGFTERGYIKICAKSVDELREWSKGEGNPEDYFSKECTICNPSERAGNERRVSASDLECDFQEQIARSKQSTAQERNARMSHAHKKPKSVFAMARMFKRNADVVVAVLERAAGVCENCGNEAPFKRASDGTPYLEVHHRIPLADDGDDTVGNAVALCPNCHRKAHYGM